MSAATIQQIAEIARRMKVSQASRYGDESEEGAADLAAFVIVVCDSRLVAVVFVAPGGEPQGRRLLGRSGSEARRARLTGSVLLVSSLDELLARDGFRLATLHPLGVLQVLWATTITSKGTCSEGMCFLFSVPPICPQ